MARSTKHYHAMNGSIGCLPDNNDVYRSKAAAIDSLVWLFDGGERGMKTSLRYSGSYYFDNPAEHGAAVCEVCECHEPNCLTDGE